ARTLALIFIDGGQLQFSSIASAASRQEAEEQGKNQRKQEDPKQGFLLASQDGEIFEGQRDDAVHSSRSLRPVRLRKTVPMSGATRPSLLTPRPAWASRATSSSGSLDWSRSLFASSRKSFLPTAAARLERCCAGSRWPFFNSASTTASPPY